MEFLGVLISAQNRNIVQLKKKNPTSLEICRISSLQFVCPEQQCQSWDISVWEGALFWQMYLRLMRCFTLSCVLEMDTTPESYLDLFPLEAIVYLTPDSENGKYFTCFRQGRNRVKS